MEFFKVKILTVVKIKKGFISSIGWIQKIKIYPSFAPLTSTPITGTKAKNIKDKTNKGITNFFKRSVSITEIKIITNKDNKVKIKCLEKKSSNPYLNVHQLMMMLKKMRKTNQEKTKSQNKRKFFFVNISPIIKKFKSKYIFLHILCLIF